MKSIVMPNTVQLNEEIKKELNTEVNETVATNLNPGKTKFTADEMWNLQRKSRPAGSRMRKWNLN